MEKAMGKRATDGSWASRNTVRLKQRGAPTAVAIGELRKSGATRTRILDAAISCLVADGYPRLSVGSVADRAGLTRAAVIYHFAGREALLEAIVTWLIDKRLELYWEAVRDVPPGANQIDHFVDAYWQQVDSDLFVAFVELNVAARTDKVLASVVGPELARFDAERSRYSRLIFSHEMRAAAGDRFETIRDVARFLIEGMAFASMVARVDPSRTDGVKAFLTAQMKAEYGVE
jgi:AcrR family transcriptional regulator